MEVTQFSIGVLIPFLELVARILVSLVIFTLLLFVDPIIAIGVSGGLGAAYLLIYLLRKGSLRKLGSDRVEANLQRFKSMNEALTSIKTSRVYGAEGFFFERFEKASENHSRIQPVVQLVSVAPRYIIEILAFGGIIAVMLYLLISGRNLQATLPLLSIYALAGYRLLPALQKGFAAAANLRHSFPVVDKLEHDLRMVETEPYSSQSSVPIPQLNQSIRLEAVTFHYEGEPSPVITDLQLEILKGQTVAFVGETGSGKTTLVDLLIGLLHAQSGRICIDDVVLSRANSPGWQRQIGYVPQDVFLFDDTVKRNIAIGSEDEAIDIDRVEWAAQTANIHAFITTELPNGYETTIGERGVRLSGGQRQRLGLARALYRQPGILILDEATSALDSITEHAVIESLKGTSGSLTVIIVAHRLSTVRHADQIYVMEKGRIIQRGSYDTLLKTSNVFREMAQLSDTN
jgi:ATP-binding cassette subfamily C protein